MDPADPRRTLPRDRALDRLHRLTLASAIVGVAATGTFATIAAASDSGSPTASSLDDVTTDADTATPAPTTAPATTDDDTTATPAPTLRPSTGRSHATTGGSS